MSAPMRPGDPAYWMMTDDFTSTPVPGVHRDSCYICRDPEFAQMGLPLCRPCPECVRQGRGQGHIPADDVACTDCGYEDGPDDYPAPADPAEPTPAQLERGARLVTEIRGYLDRLRRGAGELE